MTFIDDAEPRTDFAGIQALTSRSAGYAVALKCLEVQAAAEARDPSLHTKTRTVLHGDAWPWYTGAIGEIEVGRMLGALGPEWFVRHSIPIGVGTKDVDHLVIGPAGVFAINTKHHSNAKVWVGDYVVRVNGTSYQYLKAGRADGLDVARRLARKVEFVVSVRPVIAVLNVHSLFDRRGPNDRTVAVVEARGLVGWLRKQPQSLSETQLALLRLAAEEPETWHIDPRAADTLRVMPRFERLAAQVGRPMAPTAAAPAPPRPVSRQGSKPRANNPPGKPYSVGGLIQVWITIAVVVAAVLIFRAVAGQECTTDIPLSCVAPTMYLVLKPLLVLLALGGLAAGAIATVVWAVRRRSRRSE